MVLGGTPWSAVSLNIADLFLFVFPSPPPPPAKAVAGIMNASLAIPGPLPVARMVRLGVTPETIRATILALFVFSYPVAITLQALMAGVSSATLKVTAALLPPTLVGILAGRILASRITERLFIRITLVLLTATSLGLYVNAGCAVMRT